MRVTTVRSPMTQRGSKRFIGSYFLYWLGLGAFSEFFRKANICCLLFVSLSMMFMCCTAKVDAFKDTLYIDPGNITDSLLPILIESDDEKEQKFESELVHNGYDNINLNEFFDIIFRYRDPDLLPIYFSIINSRKLHPYFKASAIYVIGETGSAKNFYNLYAHWQKEKNDLIREYIASALGKISNTTHIPILEKMEQTEKNAYVRKTIAAAISRINGSRRTRIAYLPFLDTIHFRRIKMFPSENSDVEHSLFARQKIDTAIYSSIPPASDCIFPHMQYKKCHSIYDKVKRPFISFGLPGVSHVGEDSGWLFAGMPVHSIMAGRVALIQHEESWGCLVCVESILPDKQIVCAYYGHLSCNLDVAIGKIVRKGDKIGEIGPSFSLENGGYRSHLHLGIEKASIGNARIAGYDDDIAHWYNPMEFIMEMGLGKF
jgi:hypothetical protein